MTGWMDEGYRSDWVSEKIEDIYFTVNDMSSLSNVTDFKAW